jgi:hypothetical protein
VQGVGLREQGHVGGGELAGKAIEGYRIALDQRFPVERTAHQPCHLLAGVTGEAFEIAQHHALVSTPEAAVAQALENRRDELVALRIVADGLELYIRCAVEKGAQLRHRFELRFVHVDHHAGNDRPKP